MTEPTTDFAQWTANQWAQHVPAADSAAAVVAIRYMNIANRLENTQIQALAPWRQQGISAVDDFRVLGLLHNTPPPGIAPQRVAETLGLPVGTTTTRLRRLTKNGWVQRHDHPTQRRSHYLALHPNRKQDVRDMYQALVSNHEQFFAALTTKQHQQLGELLKPIT